MKTIGSLVERAAGPLVFFREVMHIRGGVVQNWDWPEWDRFFALAEQHVLGYRVPLDAEDVPAGSDPPKDAALAWPELTRCLLGTWKSAKTAQKAGFTCAQWRRMDKDRVDGLIAQERALQAQYAQERQESQQRAEQAKRAAASIMPPIAGRKL